ncbi:MAG TPA: BlaI/MecI/CopY family transcriptional regulator [Thermoanaerobaculia bacterium]|nr:BlaI/MecI/CopY family transcriptional regulator [Thermoanaerobaculia bacterium]
MTPRHPTIGGQELELLRWIEARTEATVGEAAEGFGGPRGLARSTVLTMMDRLRRKGHLGRRRVDGVYRFAPAVGAGEAVRRAVADFVDRTLAGSVTPMVDYLVEREELSDEELAELEALVERLAARRREEAP